MRKTILLLCLLISLVAQAQHKPIQFGFTGGVNIGWYSFPDSETHSSDGVEVGGTWGFVADIFLMEGYSFTSGFNVLYINGNSAFSTDSGTYNRDYRTQYIQLPLLLSLKTKEIKDKFRIYGQIGYGLGFLLRAKTTEQYTPNNGEEVESETFNVYDELTFTRSSLILAVGVEVPLHGSTYIRAGFKFDNCFVNMVKTENLSARNRFIELNVAVIF